MSKSFSFVMMIGFAGLLAGCATTRQQTKGVPENSGFLVDYSQLEPGSKGQASYIYEKDGVDWAQYKSIWIKPVELWASDDPNSPMGKLKPEDQQRLIDLAHTNLNNALSKDYAMVDHGGPGVLVIHAALTDAKPGKVVVGLISNVYLPLKLVSFAKQSIAGTGIGVGSVTIEAELLDGQSNQRLVAVVDSRSGTTAIRSKLDGTWGDVNLSLQYWSERLATRLAEERAKSPVKTELE
jgi:hypothetical protein